MIQPLHTMVLTWGTKNMDDQFDVPVAGLVHGIHGTVQSSQWAKKAAKMSPS